MEDKVIFVQPFFVGLDQGGSRALQTLPGNFLGEAGEVRVPHPAAGEPNQRVPIAGKRQFENYAQHAVVVILDLGVQTLTGLEDQRFDSFDNGRTLISDISRSRMFETGLLAARAENGAQVVEANLLAYVELNQHEDGALQGLVLGLDEASLHRRRKYGSAFVFHGISAFSLTRVQPGTAVLRTALT